MHFGSIREDKLMSSDLKKADWYNLRGAAYRIMAITGQQ